MKRLFLLSISLLSACQNPELTQLTTKDWVVDKTFTSGIEGPAVDKLGQLFAVNYKKQGTIGVVTSQNNTELYLTLPGSSVGNGIRFDNKGNMYIADYVNHNIWQFNNTTKHLALFAHNSQMNQPNDIAIMDSGVLFASDPNWSKSTGKLWRIDENGNTTLLEDNMGTTNGIEVSPDNKFLYVNESVQRTIWRYDLDKKGRISNKQTFYQFDEYGLDGMRTDNQGNLYVARYGAGKVAVLSPQGKLIKTIKLKGQHPTNVAFGGKDGKQVFVTMQKRGAIETFNNNIPGRNYSK